MGVADAEGHPVHLVRGALTYFPWLLWEIAKSAWAVSKLILNPRLPISPTMTKVEASQKTTIGVVSYANSITLTPARSRRCRAGDVLRSMPSPATARLDLKAGDMDRRVTRMRGSD